MSMLRAELEDGRNQARRTCHQEHEHVKRIYGRVIRWFE